MSSRDNIATYGTILGCYNMATYKMRRLVTHIDEARIVVAGFCRL